MQCEEEVFHSLAISSPANNILRLAVDGRITMYFRPPGYSGERGTCGEGREGGRERVCFT